MNRLNPGPERRASNTSGCVVVVGVGGIEGIGGAVAKRFSQEGLHVYVVGRTQSKLDGVVRHIRSRGGKASAIVCDLRNSDEVAAMFDVVKSSGANLEAVIYNAAYRNTPRRFMHTSAEFIEANWRVTCLAGVIVAQTAARLMLPQQRGTVIITGATASLRGKPLFAAFASAKAVLRSFALSLAQELAPQGVHVVHVVIDGIVEGDRVRSALGGLGRLWLKIKGRPALMQPAQVAHNYWQLHSQTPEAWSHELELRPFKEKF